MVYVPVLAFALALMFARTLLMARILSFDEFGEFSQALLISSTFCMLACLGLQLMLQRDMPIMLFKGRQVASIIALVQCVVVAGICFAIAGAMFLIAFPVPGFERLTVLAGLVHGFSQQVFLVATVESRSRGQSIRYAVQNLLRGVLVLVGGLVAATLWGRAINVILVESAVAFVLMAVMLSNALRSVDLHSLATLRLAVGRMQSIRWISAISLLLMNSVGFVVINADRWIAAQTLEKPQFSTYAFAWTLLMVGQALQAVLSASVFPYLSRTFAKSGLEDSYRIAFRLSCGLLLAGALIFGPAVLIIKFAISSWFPAFQDSTPLVSLFVFVAAIRIADFWSSFLIILGKERTLIYLNLTAMIVSFLVWSWLVKPWSEGPPELRDIGMLAALLSLSSYALTAAAAWRIRASRQ